MSRCELSKDYDASPRGGCCCKLSSPAHLAQYFNIRDLSNVTKERVELCRIRLVKVGQECKQKQGFEREPPRLPPLDYLKIRNKLKDEERTIYADRNHCWEKISPQ